MDNQTPRRGRAATSNGAESQRAPIEVGDIDDLHAFVGKIARSVTQHESDLEELTDEGIVLAAERYAQLMPGDSLQKSLTGWLEFRLRDHWRIQHRELRRNSRAGTTYLLPTPTGLSWEHAALTAGQPVTNEQKMIESRLNLSLITSAEDLRNPRTIGRMVGVPSYAALATAMSEEAWATIREERELGSPGPFQFVKKDIP
jgi:DNA-directed RNA polymerase specialized sigma24 family protein